MYGINLGIQSNPAISDTHSSADAKGAKFGTNEADTIRIKN